MKKIFLSSFLFILSFSRVCAFSVNDSATRHKFLSRLQISFNAGLSVPLGHYGSDMPYLGSTIDDYFVGFASLGFTGDFTGSLRIVRTLHFIAMASLIHQPLNASGLLEENGFGSNNLNVSGNYSYNHISFLFGPAWSFPSKNYSFGFRLLLGELLFNVPSIKATGNYTSYQIINYKYYYSTQDCNFNFHSNYNKNYIGGLGLTYQKTISQHVFLSLNVNLLFSTIQFDTPCTITDMSGNYVGSSALYRSTNVTMSDFTLGIGYNP